MPSTLIRRTARLREAGPQGIGRGSRLIRRLSPYALPGVFLWLKADDSTVGNGNPDGAPVNRIGGGPAPNQGTAGSRPLLRVGTGPGGRSYWEFDGVDDCWTFTDTWEPLTVYLVSKTRRTVNGNAWALGWRTADAASSVGVDVMLNNSAGESRYLWNDTADGSDRAVLTGTNLDTYVVLSARRSGTALTIWRSNNAARGAATHTGTLITLQGNAAIGARFTTAATGFEQLNLVELVVCNQPHPDTLRQQMSRVLAAQAGLADSSPL